MTTGTIICDVTDPEEGRTAAAFAGALGSRLGLRVVLVLVGEHELPTGLDGDVEARFASGDRAEALARTAAEEGADLIIVGSRPVGLGGRNLRCRLVRDLEAETPVPVLVAPPATRRRSRRRLELAAPAEIR
jgi:nucleotide-binding universal stress UspA family protein